jgi:hypothetical protein
MALEVLHPLAEALVDFASGRRTREGLVTLVDDAFAGLFAACNGRLADTDDMVERLIADADPRMNVEAMACTICARFIAAEFRR